MSLHSSDMEDITIGELLRETRIQRGFDLLAVAEETRISLRALQAIEDNNFNSLPAEVFTRGFYTLYAKALSLDPNEILERYVLEKKKLPKTGTNATPPPLRLAQDMGNMADRPTSLPFSYFGLILFLFLIFGAFLCWYFRWNPASYLSEKLRSLEEPQHTEQAKLSSEEEPETSSLHFEVEPLSRVSQRSSQPEAINFFSPATVTAATTRTEEQLPPLSVSPAKPKYLVNAVFSEETQVSLTIDNQPQRSLSFKNGESITWQAGKNITLSLPSTTHARITLNDVPLDLPKPKNDIITLTIPEDMLR